MGLRIDCDTCLVRGLACHDCVVTVLLGPPPETGFDDDEQRALSVLADSGLVPKLRMVDAVATHVVDDETDDRYDERYGDSHDGVADVAGW